MSSRHTRIYMLHALRSASAFGRPPTKLMSCLFQCARPTLCPHPCCRTQLTFVLTHVAICVEFNLFVGRWFFIFFLLRGFGGGGGCNLCPWFHLGVRSSSDQADAWRRASSDILGLHRALIFATAPSWTLSWPTPKVNLFVGRWSFY